MYGSPVEHILDGLRDKLVKAHSVREELSEAQNNINNTLGELGEYIVDLEGLIDSIEEVPSFAASVFIDVDFDSDS